MSTLCFSQVDHWESVVLPGDTWYYMVPSSQPSASWNLLDFDDSNWAQGISGFGYGDGDDATLVPEGTISVYLRKTFDIIDINGIDRIRLDIDYDDGFVAYLNGQEIARDLISGVTPNYDQLSDGHHNALLPNGQKPEYFDVDMDLMAEGTNVIAVQVHNQSSTSSDMTALPVLSLGINNNGYNYRSTPSWFSAPTDVDFQSSNLPIVVIETVNNQSIPLEPKIAANMIIVDRGIGQRNDISDVTNLDHLDFKGVIKIEVRGSSSSLLPKKQYALTTYDSLGQKENVKILGMPKDNDWILNGIAYDSSLIRDYLSYQLSNQIGQYASRGKFCEVMLNGNYEGLYLFQEKLKIDDNRINIKKIQSEDLALPKLTGGYITKTDKIEGEDLEAWIMPNYGGWGSSFVHEYPKSTEIKPAQHEYIKGEFERLANTSNNKNSSVEDGYPSVIDVPSFIDFMILNEFSANVDGYQFSTFFHKERNGKLRAGPIWDFNLTYGNDLFFWGYDRSFTYGWQFDDGGNTGAKFWKDLFDDPIYKCYLSKRWQELTYPGMPLNTAKVMDFIDATVLHISEAAARQEALWGTTDVFVQQVRELKSFISDRNKWLSNQLTSIESCLSVTKPALVISKINYHPSTEEDEVSSDYEFIEITNMSDLSVDLTGIYLGELGLTYQFPKGIFLGGNTSLYLASDTKSFEDRYGFTPFDEFTRSLSNESEKILLLDGYGNVIDEVTYSDKSPWPTEADGSGAYLVLEELALDNNDGANWEAQFSLPIYEGILGGLNTLQPLLSIFPNPSQERLHITANGWIKVVKIWNIEGKCVDQYRFDSEKVELVLDNYRAGTYYLEIQMEEGRFLRRIIKN
tara:strand:+ start:4177 stop:6741 length:2565 start_codon:yes stop_codon:yes gene_type:complete